MPPPRCPGDSAGLKQEISLQSHDLLISAAHWTLITIYYLFLSHCMLALSSSSKVNEALEAEESGGKMTHGQSYGQSISQSKSYGRSLSWQITYVLLLQLLHQSLSVAQSHCQHCNRNTFR